MISAGQYVTLKTSTINQTLSTCELKIELKRNSRYYFNADGIYLKVTDDLTGNLIIAEAVWKPPKGDTESDTEVIDGRTVYSVPNLSFTISSIALTTSDTEKRLKFRNVTVEVYFYVSSIKKTLFIHKERLESIQLPLPRIHEFSVGMSVNYTPEELASDTAKVDLVWKTILPRYNTSKFYELEVLCDFYPGEPIFTAINVADSVRSFTYTPPSLARNEVVTFTLNIYNLYDVNSFHKKIYDTRQVSIRMPRKKYETVYGKKDSKLSNVLSVSIKKDDIIRSVERVYYKQGNQWYTD